MAFLQTRRKASLGLRGSFRNVNSNYDAGGSLKPIGEMPLYGAGSPDEVASAGVGGRKHQCGGELETGTSASDGTLGSGMPAVAFTDCFGAVVDLAIATIGSLYSPSSTDPCGQAGGV